MDRYSSVLLNCMGSCTVGDSKMSAVTDWWVVFGLGCTAWLSNYAKLDKARYRLANWVASLPEARRDDGY